MISRAQFLQNLTDSGLSVPTLIPAGEDGVLVARELVAAKALTAYQAAAVLERRFGDLRLGNYEILDQLGRGGMGVVYKARHRRMKRIVALKVLSKQAADETNAVKRFEREVEAAARLAHPNIVMAFDADEAEQGPFLVMEFVDGWDLAREVALDGPLAVADAIGCVIQAARGIECAHNAGIVHRDIKPANLMRHVSGIIKVTDLGIARIGTTESHPTVRTALTATGTGMGTVDYMAPEQAQDAAVIDGRADVYALGCTLYFLLTGKPPYSGGSVMAVLLQHRDALIPSLRAARADVPDALDAIFEKMVAKDPADRHPTMADVIRDLEVVQAGIASSNTDFRLGTAPQAEAPAGDTLAGGVVLAPPDTGFVVAAPGSFGVPGLTVVLVEPSRTQAGIIRRQLLELGVGSIQMARSGRESLDAAKTHNARVIVSAMQLPDMTGADLAREVLLASTPTGVGFVLTTSEDDGRVSAILPKSPHLALLKKPFDLGQLAQSIASVLM